MMSLEGSSIEFVLTHHKQGVAFMAEVHGRLTDHPAGCIGTLRPGAIANRHTDRLSGEQALNKRLGDIETTQ